MRLQRWLALCGLGSRRACEVLIFEGRVTLNGELVSKLGTTLHPATDHVRVDGKSVTPPSASPQQVWALNKPRGVTSTLADPHARRTLRDLLPPVFPRGKRRLFPVGRLDRESEGLILLTDDGALAHGLLHPSHPVEKEYEVWIEGEVATPFLRRCKEGLRIQALDGEPTADGTITVHAQIRAAGRRLDPSRQVRKMFLVTLTEGRKRQIRRMVQAAGARVVFLRRIRIGPIHLGDLPPGDCRRIDGPELESLREAGKR